MEEGLLDGGKWVVILCKLLGGGGGGGVRVTGNIEAG